MVDSKPRPSLRAVSVVVTSVCRHVVIRSAGDYARREQHQHDCRQYQKSLSPHVCPPPLRTQSGSKHAEWLSSASLHRNPSNVSLTTPTPTVLEGPWRSLGRTTRNSRARHTLAHRA